MSGAEPLSDALLMTMAGIAYGSPVKIADYLAAAEPTKGWTTAWLPDPGDPPVNFAFLAVNPAGDAYVLAIRGTYPDPFSSAYWDDARQDSPFGEMKAWPRAQGAKISGGTNEGFQNLITLKDAKGRTLQDYVTSLPVNASVMVTGHSLGGTLTPVLALWLAETFPDLDVSAASFAGMTPGNAKFAALFGPGTPLNGKVRRVYNTLDLVPYGWNRVLATRSFFQPAPQGGLLVFLMLLLTSWRLRMGGYGYTAIGTAVALNGVVRPPWLKCTLPAYVVETLHQHLPDTYLELLGAPPLPFSILVGTAIAPRDHAAITLDGRSIPHIAYLDEHDTKR
jgi:hypothetical protein